MKQAFCFIGQLKPGQLLHDLLPPMGATINLLTLILPSCLNDILNLEWSIEYIEGSQVKLYK